MARFWPGFIFGILASIAVPLLVVASGVVNFAAGADPTSAEAAFAKFAVGRSMARRISDATNPFTGDQLAAASGFRHYADTCLACHGAPDVPPKKFAKGLNPPAPDLTESLSKRSDADLFWIVKNGILMTRMPALGPTHDDEDIWKIISIVRNLPDLSDKHRSQLREALGSGHEHTGHGHQTDSHDHANGHTH